MKNYNKIFADQNKTRFDMQSKLKAEVENRDGKIGNWIIILTLISCFLLVYFGYGWTFLGFHWEGLTNLFYKGEGEFGMMIIGIILLILIAFVTWSIISNQVNKSRRKLIDTDKKNLESEAKKFAASVYLDDLISALSRVFTLDATFKANFKTIIIKFEWLKYCGFSNYGQDITYFYDEDGEKVWIEEKLTIKHEGCKYHLKRWSYEEDAFRFFFEKINANGLVEKDVEFRLPVVE